MLKMSFKQICFTDVLKMSEGKRGTTICHTCHREYNNKAVPPSCDCGNVLGKTTTDNLGS
jgi:hypothetical protein